MLNKQEAEAALNQIEQTQRRSIELIGYWRSGIYVQIWGVVWIVAYMGSYFLPEVSNIIWLICNGFGVTATAILSLRDRNNAQQEKRLAWAMVVVASFGLLVSYNLLAHRPGTLPVFWTCLIMSAYILAGLWAGTRWIVLGAAVIAISVATYFYFMPWFDLIMAFAGGGGLLLVGTWMARAK